MNRKRKRNGFGSIERGRKSLRHLKDRYENTENCSPYDLAKNLIEKNVPKPLECLAPILARLATRTTKRNELGLACKMVGKLVVYKIKGAGYDIRDTRHETKDANEYGTVWIWKDFSRNVFEIMDYEVTYPNEKDENMKREFEKEFLILYGLNIEFGSLTKE